LRRRAGFHLRDQIGAFRRGDDRAAIRIAQPIGDLRLGSVIADRHADRVRARYREAAFDPRHAVRQQDRNRVLRADAEIGEMAREIAGARIQVRVSDRAMSIAIRDLCPARPRVAGQQNMNRCDEVRVQHVTPC